MKVVFTGLIALFTLFIAYTAPAKDSRALIKANWYYEHYAYAEAIEWYEKLDEEERSVDVLGRLGDCYRLTGDLEKAEATYGKTVRMKGCRPSLRLRYGQLLMQKMQYDSAKVYLKEYKLTFILDKRADNLIAACDSAPVMLKARPTGEVSLLDFNTDGSEFAPTLWRGKLVFTADTVINLKKKTSKWNGKPFYNMYSVTCDDNGNCGNDLETIGQKKNINIKFHDGPATFTANGDSMYFTRTRYLDKGIIKNSVSNDEGTVLLEIMIASGYDEGAKQFETITPFQFNNTSFSVAHPAISPDGKTIVFASAMHRGIGGTDLYMCRKVSQNRWSKPMNLGDSVNTEGEELFPYWADDSTLFFSSDGHVGLGGLDIYETHWNKRENTFTRPENMGIPINSSYDDMSLAMFADRRSTYISSNRPAEKGGDNIYYYKKD